MNDSIQTYSSYFFIKNKKKNLAKEYLDNLDTKIWLKTINQMKLLEIYGIDTDKVSIKKFQNNIWKIRTKDAFNNVRLFFYIIDNSIYYLYGFNKTTQKTPEGKKVIINNLKSKLLSVHKNSNFNNYILKINWEKYCK